MGTLVVHKNWTMSKFIATDLTHPIISLHVKILLVLKMTYLFIWFSSLFVVDFFCIDVDYFSISQKHSFSTPLRLIK